MIGAYVISSTGYDPVIPQSVPFGADIAKPKPKSVPVLYAVETADKTFATEYVGYVSVVIRVVESIVGLVAQVMPDDDHEAPTL